MEARVKAPGTPQVIAQPSLIEIQPVFAGKVRTGMIGKTALDELRGLFFSGGLCAPHPGCTAIVGGA